MSASQCRCLGPTGNGGVGRTSRRAADAPRDVAGGRRAVIGLLGAMIVLGAGLLPPNRSRAQEAPAKAEAPKESEPAKQDQEAVEPLSVRYRFIETYSDEEKPARPDMIGPYQVGSLETVQFEDEKPQGAPDRNEGTIQVIYTERPAKVTKLGEVTDLIRYYDEFRPGGTFNAVRATPPLVKGLTLWCRLHKGGTPEIMSLTDQRPLREEEFNVITRIRCSSPSSRPSCPRCRAESGTPGRSHAGRAGRSWAMQCPKMANLTSRGPWSRSARPPTKRP